MKFGGRRFVVLFLIAELGFSISRREHRFFRASESGKEVSRLFEANKIRVGFSEAKGSSGSGFLVAFHMICCRGKTALVFNEPTQNVTKVITWNCTTSSRSSSSKNPLATIAKDDNDDSGSDFNEEYCMIAGSHSSTLDRLYAWERNLYDEVKVWKYSRINSGSLFRALGLYICWTFVKDD